MTKRDEILQLLYKPDHESKQAAIAMIDELVKDSERLEWVVEKSATFGKSFSGDWVVEADLKPFNSVHSARTFREAIDKARGE